ncbi:MAG: META domain-containing protein [Pseudomonas sp.]
MKRAVLLGLLGSTLLGCAAEPSPVKTDRSYMLEWIGERPLVDRSHLTMTLGQDGRAYGNAGCNHWFAPYTLEGQKMSFGIVGSTRRVCAPALMEQEQRFLDSLTKVQRWDISPIEQLRLWPAPEEGKPLRFWLEDS